MIGMRRNQSGVVAVNLVLVIAFALYAVIQLSRTTLAVKQIKQRVGTITTEVGPGSNVSRLDETAILNTVADRADQILAAAKPLSGQANDVLVAAQSIDNTVSSIQSTAGSINTTVNSINGRLRSLAPVVNDIRGRPGTIDNPGPGTGTTGINIRVDNAIRNINGIGSDLDTVLNPHVVRIDASAAGINAAANNLVGSVLCGLPLVGGALTAVLGGLCAP